MKVKMFYRNYEQNQNISKLNIELYQKLTGSYNKEYVNCLAFC